MRVLFVSHDAYRAGATIFLLNVLKWLRENTDLSFSVLLRSDGELRPEFEQICETYISSHVAKPHKKLWKKLLRQPGLNRSPQTSTLQNLIEGGNFDLIYLNTITLGDLLSETVTGSIPILTHVHELAYSIRTFARGYEALVLSRSTVVLTVSDAVRRHLANSLQCPPHKLHLIYGFVPVHKSPSADRDTLRVELLKPLGFGAHDIIIGLCGTADMRKGVDLLVPLGLHLPAEVGGRPIRFLWVGSNRPEYPLEMAKYDIDQAGLRGRVHFVGSTTRVIDWISCFDIHLLLAREDPFPLVVMEAAALGIPTVCFGDAGGAAEFVRGDAGAVSPYLDLAAMAACVMRLLTDDASLRAAGAVAQCRVRAEHDASVAVPKILALMQSLVTGRP